MRPMTLLLGAAVLAFSGTAGPAAILTPLELHQGRNILGAVAVAVSPDGHHVYAVAEHGNALAVYARNPDGSLDAVEVLRDGVGGFDLVC